MSQAGCRRLCSTTRSLPSKLALSVPTSAVRAKAVKTVVVAAVKAARTAVVAAVKAVKTAVVAVVKVAKTVIAAMPVAMAIVVATAEAIKPVLRKVATSPQLRPLPARIKSRSEQWCLW